MSTISDYTNNLRGLAGIDAVWLIRTVRRGLKRFLRWRLEQAAIAQLSSMNDRELRDIGLQRSDIGFVVRGQLPRTNRRAP
jgi:uncharacterized protein YjiS (DUF1127 family)